MSVHRCRLHWYNGISSQPSQTPVGAELDVVVVVVTLEVDLVEVVDVELVDEVLVVRTGAVVRKGAVVSKEMVVSPNV